MYVSTFFVIADKTDIGAVLQAKSASKDRYIQSVAAGIVDILRYIVVYYVVANAHKPWFTIGQGISRHLLQKT